MDHLAEKAKMPFVLYGVNNQEGHVNPALQICAYLLGQGFDVALLTGRDLHFPINGKLRYMAPDDNLVKPKLEIPKEWMTAPLGPLLGPEFSRRFPKAMSMEWESLRSAMLDVLHRVGYKRLRENGLIILSDTACAGTVPLKLGASLPLELEGINIKTVGIGVVPRVWATPFHPPFGLGISYNDDYSDEAVKRNLQIHAELKGHIERTGGASAVRRVLDAHSCSLPADSLFRGYDIYKTAYGEHLHVPHTFLELGTVVHDTTLQMCMESLEFPIPAAVGSTYKYVPPRLKFAGFLPTKELPADLEYPPWFHEISCSSELSSPLQRHRKVVLVAQGTVSRNHEELLLPTILALEDDMDILVIALLCLRGATLDTSCFDGGILPANVRVLDYFPYDAILPHVNVFVSSSGFGGLSHAVANGVPLVQGGYIIDKPDIGRRVEYSGLGVYLGRETYPADPSDIRDAVYTVLENEGVYKGRALELQAESLTKYHPLQRVKDEILALAHSSSL